MLCTSTWLRLHLVSRLWSCSTRQEGGHNEMPILPPKIAARLISADALLVCAGSDALNAICLQGHEQEPQRNRLHSPYHHHEAERHVEMRSSTSRASSSPDSFFFFFFFFASFVVCSWCVVAPLLCGRWIRARDRAGRSDSSRAPGHQEGVVGPTQGNGLLLFGLDLGDPEAGGELGQAADGDGGVELGRHGIEGAGGVDRRAVGEGDGELLAPVAGDQVLRPQRRAGRGRTAAAPGRRSRDRRCRSAP